MSSEVIYNTAMPGMFNVPKGMGAPKAGQMEGTPLELLAELAGRVCYDSFGRGRSSAEWHQHVKDVGHLSVYEHCTFTVEFAKWEPVWTEELLNRPSLWAHRMDRRMRLTLNLRHVLEWGTTPLGRELAIHGHVLAPQVIPNPGEKIGTISRLVKPAHVNEVWVSVYMEGSRCWSHELVRHGDWTGISQRSTRYVDEDETPVYVHPLMQEYIDEYDLDADREYDEHVERSKQLYRKYVDRLEAYLVGKGEPKDYARKQARGAARFFLPMGLGTKMVFSASLAQWSHIFGMRCNRFADGEIAEIMAEVKKTIFTEKQYAEDDDSAGS